MNFAEIAGHLGSDPETRFTPNGMKVTSFRVAVNIKRKGQEQTIWWRVTVWGDRFDKMLTYLKKGSAIIIFGEMAPPQIYTDKNGNPQVSLEITAEVMRFSPFGKSDRTGQDSYGRQAESPKSFGEQTFGGDFGLAAMEVDAEGSPSEEHSEEQVPF